MNSVSRAVSGLAVAVVLAASGCAMNPSGDGSPPATRSATLATCGSVERDARCVIKGSGFTPGETVYLTNSVSSSADHATRADDGGAFAWNWGIDTSYFGTVTVTAKGAESGLVATASFTRTRG